MIGNLKIEYPHEKLWPIAFTDYRFKSLCAGRRIGKTAVAKYLMAKCLLKDGGKVTYVSPTIKMADEIWNVFHTGLQTIASSYSTQQKIIRLKNDAVFKILSADRIGDGFRGFSNDLIVVDEAAMIPNLQEMFFLSALPTLADRKGRALFISTPRGRNDFYDIWKMGDPKTKHDVKYKEFEDYYSWQLRTSDNPFIPLSEIELARKSMPEKFFNQEYLGEFMLDGGEFFRRVEEVSTIPQREPYRGNFVFGLDFGKKNDYTVISVIDIDEDKQVAAYRFNKILWDWQRDEIKKYYELWNPVVIEAEENSVGDPNIEILEDWGLPIERFQTTNKSKKNILEALSVDMENFEIYLLNDQVQIEELESFQLTISDNGNYKFGAPSGRHDDMVIALALANDARRNYHGTVGFAMPDLWSK